MGYTTQTKYKGIDNKSYIPFKERLFKVILLTNPLEHAKPDQGAVQGLFAYPKAEHVHIEYPVLDAIFKAPIKPQMETSWNVGAHRDGIYLVVTVLIHHIAHVTLIAPIEVTSK